MVQTDFGTVSKILLAYPERYYNSYDELVPFYDELISLIPNHFETWIITNNNQTKEKLEQKFSHKNLHILGLKGWDDIWLRDCVGLTTKNKVVKPIYSPGYCSAGNHHDYYQRLNKLSRMIIKDCLGKEIIDINLKLDGGNFVCNDKFAFMTDKVLEENSILSQKEIEHIILESTGLIPKIVAKNRCDVIGHTDAYMSFLDNNRVLLSNYPSFPFLKDDIDFINELEEELKASGIKIIKFYDRPIYESANCGCTNKKSKPCFYSARGNYMNFIRLNNLIILPEYNLSTKTETNYYNRINQEILVDAGFEVKRLNCDGLAKFGGVLHCISHTS